MNIWNELVKIMNKHDKSSDVYNQCKMLIGQLRTAGGIDLMRKEVEVFIVENK